MSRRATTEGTADTSRSLHRRPRAPRLAISHLIVRLRSRLSAVCERCPNHTRLSQAVCLDRRLECQHRRRIVAALTHQRQRRA